MRATERALRLAAMAGAVLLLAVLAVGPGRFVMADSRAVEVRIEDGRIADGTDPIRVTQGDVVEIRWASDAAVILHLHGYDVEASAAPDAPGIMSFEAHAAGRFPVELHAADGMHRTLLYLEVHPR